MQIYLFFYLASIMVINIVSIHCLLIKSILIYKKFGNNFYGFIILFVCFLTMKKRLI